MEGKVGAGVGGVAGTGVGGIAGTGVGGVVETTQLILYLVGVEGDKWGLQGKKSRHRGRSSSLIS